MPSRKRTRRVGSPGRPRLAHWKVDGTAKTRFPSEDEANRAAFAARLDHGVDLSVYRCEFCEGWHLGNQSDDR